MASRAELLSNVADWLAAGEDDLDLDNILRLAEAHIARTVRSRSQEMRTTLTCEGLETPLPRAMCAVDDLTGGYTQTLKAVTLEGVASDPSLPYLAPDVFFALKERNALAGLTTICCLLYTSPSPRDRTRSRMPSSA